MLLYRHESRILSEEFKNMLLYGHEGRILSEEFKNMLLYVHEGWILSEKEIQERKCLSTISGDKTQRM